jgi:hypothetical protein
MHRQPLCQDSDAEAICLKCIELRAACKIFNVWSILEQVNHRSKFAADKEVQSVITCDLQSIHGGQNSGLHRVANGATEGEKERCKTTESILHVKKKLKYYNSR